MEHKSKKLYFSGIVDVEYLFCLTEQSLPYVILGFVSMIHFFILSYKEWIATWNKSATFELTLLSLYFNLSIYFQETYLFVVS